MLLDDLVVVIESVKERISKHGTVLRQNETRTRMALIDPLLTALGWDVSDPAVVLPEYQTGGKADYALLASEGKPSVVIEAKHLDEPLASHRMQMVNYANVSGIPYAGLTDGNHWEVYKVFDQAPIEERLILNLSINSSTPAHEAALKLLLLWRPNLSTGQPVVANPPVLVTTSDLLPGDLIPPAPAPNPGPTGNWISLSVVDAGKGNSPPTEIRFSGREPQSVNFWWQVLVEVADELASNGMLKAADCPIAGLGFVSSSNATYKRHKAISGGLYVNVNWRADNIIKHSRRLLTHFNVDPATVALCFQ